MRGVQILAVLAAATALGAVAGGLVAATRTSTPVSNDAVFDRLDGLQKRLDGLRNSVARSSDDLADVSERLVALELELSRRDARPARTNRLEIAPPSPISTSEDETSAAVERATAEAQRALDKAMKDLDTVRFTDMQKQFAKNMEMRALPEDERWRRVEQELGLSSVQVQELKDAAADLEEARAAATVEREIQTGSGTMKLRTVDGTKTRGAQEAFDKRVDNALNDEQKKAWKEGGYAGVFGGRRPRVAFASGAGGPGGTGVTIEAAEIEIRGSEDE